MRWLPLPAQYGEISVR